MDYKDAFKIIEAISATSSRTEKERLLAELAKDQFGAWLLNQTYSPFITYGVVPAANVEGRGGLSLRQEDAQPLLDALARRELTGNAAKQAIDTIFEALNVTAAALLYRILVKDLKCGINIKTVNNVMPGLITVFSVMRANPYNAKKVKKWWILGEPKLDGYRCTFVCRDGNAGFFTRSGNRMPALDHLIPDMLATAEAAFAAQTEDNDINARFREIMKSDGQWNFVVDGEAMTGLFASAGALRRKSEQARDAEFHIYDIMSWADFDAVGAVGDIQIVRRIYAKRFADAAVSAAVQIVPIHKLENDEQVQSVYQMYLDMPVATYLARGDKALEEQYLKTMIDEETGEPKKMEGMIVKDPQGLYQKKKCNEWMKLKAEETEDLPIIGFYNGEPGSKNADIMGGLIVNRNGVAVRIGGGWSDSLRKELYDLWLHDAAILGASADPGFKPGWSTFDPLPSGLKLLGRLTEIKFHEVTPDGSLRHPNFRRFRDDKAGEVESKEAA